ncbi:YceI family protein [Maribacter sp. ACAM166]|jgi:polyisoprenoid-binding protein YceI|uniref:YceI family protein n=1 Tax=Maribacter sp. ACAM166 TaxID=2508996 RepID=UPI0010FD6C39|nr:YceI family protein [Maribacter sp. ACAM166]TLP70555.1 YceI family protein [Maribacter sp. ACAM166]
MKAYFLTILIGLFYGHDLLAQLYATENGKAKFEATMPFNSYDGSSDQLQGMINLETNVVEFSLPVKSIKTGIDKRDNDMYELLNVEQNPNVLFKGSLIDNYKKENRKQIVKVKGDFTLAGVTRQVTITGSLEPVKNGLKLIADWSLRITDYNVERPSILFVKVDDKHDLSISVLLK